MKMPIIVILLAFTISATAQIPRIASDAALDKLLSSGLGDYVLDLHALQQTQALNEGMAVYRIAVKPDGTLDRFERISGDPELQAQAEQSIALWHFGQVRLQDKPNEATAWWSMVGVCYGSGWGMLVPCEPPAIDAREFRQTTLPVRLVLQTKIVAGKSDKFEFGPLKRIKGWRFSRPEAARLARIEGRIVVLFTITPEGKVTDIRKAIGHPLLVTDAGDKLKEWKFDPITILGAHVPATVLLTIDYHAND